MTSRDAFLHLPELQGRLTPVHASGLRLTDEVLAEWDAQARGQGLPAHWRLPDADVERSRRHVLTTITAQHDPLWVFAYGSLMWNPGFHFDEVRKATLPGYVRRFALGTTIGRGTPDCPGLVLTLQRDGDNHAGQQCEGLVFRIPAPLVPEESRLLWRREMITGAYCPELLPLQTPQGTVNQALVLTANTAHTHYRGDLSMQMTAATIARACGRIGSNREYLDQLIAQLGVLGIEDSYVHALAEMVETTN
ncbi:gamma-glutamylcyclotransferase [Acidovorax sp. ACV01]|uniref:gamma-glutamylcyclotransferase n=1 Tax=Acidovorax sp. ACV01 TaxID=2769311 RepID=UPI001780956A|nr:gamma-glutamylcyclotransferase [Acidovorax sp. ACV01]MBD9392745.1 gamma-glutamylcyclotransferase [Acidovorax sp. ACV01]